MQTDDAKGGMTPAVGLFLKKKTLEFHTSQLHVGLLMLSVFSATSLHAKLPFASFASRFLASITKK